MKLNMNIILLLLGIIIAYYIYSIMKKPTNVVEKTIEKIVESEETVESEIEEEVNIKEDNTEILTDDSNYDTEKFLNDNLLDDVDLHNNNEEDFLNNIEKLLEKEDALNNMLEDDNTNLEKKNVEEYSIEIKDNSDKQDIQTTIENNAPINNNTLEYNDNWEHNSLMFRDILKENINPADTVSPKEETKSEDQPEVSMEAPKENQDIQSNEIKGYTDDYYYNLN